MQIARMARTISATTRSWVRCLLRTGTVFPMGRESLFEQAGPLVRISTSALCGALTQGSYARLNEICGNSAPAQLAAGCLA